MGLSDETDWEKFREEAGDSTALWQVAWAGDTIVGQVRTRVVEGEAELRVSDGRGPPNRSSR